MRTEGDVNRSVIEEQGSSLISQQCAKSWGKRRRSRNLDPAELDLWVSRREIQSVKPLKVVWIDSGGLSLGYDIKSRRAYVNGRGARNSDEGDDILAGDAHQFGCRNGLLSRRNEIRLPQLHARVGIGVKGKNAVFLGCHDDDVVYSAAGDGEISHVKRLRVGIAVKQTRKKPAKRRRSDGRGSQCEFFLILARARGVVAPGEHARKIGDHDLRRTTSIRIRDQCSCNCMRTC